MIPTGMRPAWIAAGLAVAVWMRLPAPAAAQAPEPGVPSLACSRQLSAVSFPAYVAFRVHGPVDACMADQFVALADQLTQAASSGMPPVTLRLLVHSETGSLAEAAAMVGALQRAQAAGVHVIAMVDGVAGGPAVLVWAAADERYVAPLALVSLPRPAGSPVEPAWWHRLLLIPARTDALATWWQEWVVWLGDRLDVPLAELNGMLQRETRLTGREVAQRGWAQLVPAPRP